MKKNPTTQLVLKNKVFVGEIKYFIYNLLASTIGSILMIVLLFVS